MLRVGASDEVHHEPAALTRAARGVASDEEHHEPAALTYAPSGRASDEEYHEPAALTDAAHGKRGERRAQRPRCLVYPEYNRAQRKEPLGEAGMAGCGEPCGEACLFEGCCLVTEGLKSSCGFEGGVDLWYTDGRLLP